ncbi:MAG: DNA cytosine methyltransferase [Candidatus Fonsibacter sp.]
MGSRQGLADKLGRGRIFQYGLAALSTKRPSAFLLDNVKGLVTQHRATFYYMLEQLRHIGNGAYNVGSQSSTPRNLASRNTESVPTLWVCSATTLCQVYSNGRNHASLGRCPKCLDGGLTATSRAR